MTNCNNSTCENCGIHNFTVLTDQNGGGSSTGDSRAIRIGNDINLDITINELNGMDIINIKSIKCFIINTTPGLDPKNHHDVHHIGLPMYHALPQSRHYGYGMYPGVPNFNCLRPNYPFVRSYNPYWHDHFCCHHKPFAPIRPHNPFEFCAPVKALAARNKVRVYFPAAAQLLCGLYSLTFIIELYEPGYHCNNLRTITVDYNNIFELVPNMEGAAGNITIDIDKQIGFNFGNVSTISNGVDLIQSIDIEGPDNVKVGEVETFRAVYTPASGNIKWQLISANDVGVVKNSTGFTTQVCGNKISNVREGKDIVTLQAVATDGSNCMAEKKIAIHNYCVDVNFANYGNRIFLQPGESIRGALYAIQEDGTRLAICEAKDGCQAVPAVNANIVYAENNCLLLIHGKEKDVKCEWQYDDVDNNTADTTSDTSLYGCDCCDDSNSYITLKNVNTSEYQKVAHVYIVSSIKGADGNFVGEEIEVICVGKNGSDGPVNPEPTPSEDSDIYLDSAQMNRNDITFVMHNADDFSVSLQELAGEDVNYWGYVDRG